MRQSDDMIDPIEIQGPGKCPNCGGSLYVVDTEVSMMELNKNGMPMNEEVTYVRCQATCNRCKKVYDMKRIGLGYEPYSEVNELEYKKEAEKRQAELKNNKENNK